MSYYEQQNRYAQIREDAEEAHSDAIEAAEEAFAKEMIVAFTQTMRKRDQIEGMELPCISRNPPYRESTHCAKDTVQQLVNCDSTWEALDKVIRESDCPLVQAMRLAMAKDHTDSVVKEIAAERVGDGLDYMRRCGAI